ncbi:MAG: putative metal-binding motif-containing protein [Myxococcota bacterium]|nr:putative metal-binding motif-containing protein [Myxococcota bacterium]MDW8361424.1 putative metal-binding motif-containing protein [Myxococcales bacterium]
MRRRTIGVWLAAALGGAACGGGEGPRTYDAGPTDATADTTVAADAGGDADGGTRPDGARPCATDAECDDGVGCTLDTCVAGGWCRHEVDHRRCDDGVFCNGDELCDPVRDCRAGSPRTCNDGNVCTLDRCDEAARICRHAPRDFDEDGDPDWHCPGGGDCDDRNPTRHSTAAEVCADGVDNDCDGELDESECGRPPHDGCDDPLDVSGGGYFEVRTEGTVADAPTSCGGAGRRDVVLSLELREPRRLTVRVDGEGLTAVALQTSCGDRRTERGCASGFPAELSTRRLEPGRYFLVVSDTSPGTLGVEVALGDPLPEPRNETCEGAIDVSAGGRFIGSTIDVRDDLTTRCGVGTVPDLVYVLETTEVRDVRIRAIAGSGDAMSFSVQRACGDEASSLRCARGAPAGARLHELPAGRYFIVLEGPSHRAVDFQLEVELLPPSAAPAGDTCATALPVPVGGSVVGTLADKQDDVAISCGFFYVDAVHRFELTERSDVTVSVDGGGMFMYQSVERSCGRGESLRCTVGSPARARLRGLDPGTYHVVVESFAGTGYRLDVVASPPSMPVEVAGNDACATAHPVPRTGGLFSGSTIGMSNDLETATCGGNARSPDAVFRVDLDAPARIVASTSGSSFDTVLHLHAGACVSRRELACDDDGIDGVASFLDRSVGPGTYFLVVDGFAEGNAGRYELEVQVLAP